MSARDRMGIATGGFLPYAKDNYDRHADLIAGTGVGWVRLDASWGSVEPERGRYHFGNSDLRIGGFLSRGLKPIPVVGYVPKWLNDDHRVAPTGSNVDAFARYVAKLAEHFGDAIERWEVWNEPNHSFYATSGDKVRAYLNLLAKTQDAILAVNPKAKVMAGGTAPTKTKADGTSINPIEWYRRLYDLGLAEHCHTVCHHAYPGTFEPTNQFSSWGRDLPPIRDVMWSHGHSGRKIWVTETGYTSGQNYSGVTFDEAKQAEMVPKLVTAGVSTQKTATCPAGDWAKFVGPVMLFSAVDPDDQWHPFGLVRSRQEGGVIVPTTKKPAYEVFKRAVAA